MKKGLIIIFGYIFFGLVISCCDSVTHPYYDFSGITIENTIYENDSIQQLIGTEFSIKLEDYTLYSQTSFNLFNTAYAMQPCTENGNAGLKFPIVEIKITTDQIYFDTIPPNTDISHLFYSRDYSDSIIALTDLEISLISNRGINPFLPPLYINNNNLVGIAHIFTFAFKKSNGDIVSGVSDSVIW